MAVATGRSSARIPSSGRSPTHSRCSTRSWASTRGRLSRAARGHAQCVDRGRPGWKGAGRGRPGSRRRLGGRRSDSGEFPQGYWEQSVFNTGQVWRSAVSALCAADVKQRKERRMSRVSAYWVSGGLAVVGLLASAASAQLVVGTTSPTTSNGAAFYLDVNTSAVTTLWNSAGSKKVNGLAADPASGRLYANDAARLNFWNYGDLGTVPTFIAGMYRTNDNVTFTATGVDGLAFANGNLYGATSF